MRSTAVAMATIMFVAAACGTQSEDIEAPNTPNGQSQAIHSYTRDIVAHDGETSFRVSVRAGDAVESAAVERLLDEMTIAEVPDSLAESLGPRSASPRLDFGGCDSLVAVTLETEADVDLSRYAWTWPGDVFEPMETVGVLRTIGAECDVPASALAETALRWKWKWYGGNLMLERNEICGVLLMGTTGILIAGSAIPPPFGLIAAAAIAFGEGYIYSKIGVRGVRLEFNWSGTVHRVVTRPEGTSPLPGFNKCANTVEICGTSGCMCEDSPDPVMCECTLRGSGDC